MKYSFKIIWAISLFLLSGCTQYTPYGECIGINGIEDKTKQYEYSAKNIILAIMFSELIAPPIVVILDEYKCPVGSL